MILAYIDPVSGTFILQILIAGIIGLLGFFRHRIFEPFRRLYEVVLRRKSKTPCEKD